MAVGVETGVDGVSLVRDEVGVVAEGVSVEDDEGCAVVRDVSAPVVEGWIELDGLSPGADELLTGVGLL